MRKGQTSMEFVILMTFMLMVFTITFVVIQKKTFDIHDLQKDTQLVAMGNLIKAEMDMANTVHQGYKKYFWIPDYINGEDYTILLNDSEVTITHDGGRHIVFLNTNRSQIYGNITKGDNTVVKNTSGIFILPGKV